MEMEVASMNDLKSIKYLYTTVTNSLRKNGVYQWDIFYPNIIVIGRDLKKGHLHALINDGICVAAVVMNEEQSSKYSGLPWSDKKGRPAVIHRLAVHPGSQGKGIGKQILLYAEEMAISKGYTSIRLDAYTANTKAITMYERANYSTVGQIQYPFRKYPYLCFEKMLNANEPNDIGM
ncbi:GNAT family N-acetyltransferase [Neobacillus cucumis]|uniref:GNAT family N-acetyltransferase n=1 Tax=Neobacillus cucumis TaxID=1740721 RepID=UPI0028535CC1|nr:GNAT family N-acetyltransferase [Neobacillus cucumis]MDR4947010.1 GNAT family N-acetyltransferase [Neobacillus cucumis]